jgi:multidrug efflux pump
MLKQPEVESMVGVLGFSFSGQGQNAALAFRDAEGLGRAHRPAERRRRWPAGPSARCRASATPSSSRSARRRSPNWAGLRLQLPPAGPRRQRPRGAAGGAQPAAGHGRQSKVLTQVRPDGLEDAPQLQLDIDRDKAAALGVGFDSINALSTALGSAYVNDFPNSRAGCSAWSCRPTRRRACSPRTCCADGAQQPGQLVPLSAFASTRWVNGPMQTIRYNGYPAMRIGGERRARLQHRRRDGRDGAPGRRSCRRASASSGPASAARRSSPATQATILLYGFSMLAVFLCLAALYESWAIPFAVMLVVPLGVLGAVLATLAARHAQRRVLPGRPDHHHRPVGQERDPDHRVREGPAGAGQGPDEATLEACPALPARS